MNPRLAQRSQAYLDFHAHRIQYASLRSLYRKFDSSLCSINQTMSPHQDEFRARFFSPSETCWCYYSFTIHQWCAMTSCCSVQGLLESA